MSENGFEILIPGGKSTSKRDWYPFVMTFNADNYRARGNDIKGMTILYNFPAFNPLTRTNILYETDSPYSSSFYGAYIIKSNSPVPFCFNGDNSVNYDEVMHAFSYDYKNLVLESLGNYNFTFLASSLTSESVEYIGYDYWIKADAKILTNSVSHSYKEARRSYLQYGRPMKKANIEFPEINMNGRLYIKYFPEISSTIIFYIMAPDINILEECDKHILSKSTLKISGK